MGFRHVVIESPCKLSYKGGYLVVRAEDNATNVLISDISSIVLQTNRVYISAYLLSELSKAKVSLVYSDEKHNPIGQCLPLYGSHNTSKRIGEQLAWGEPVKKRVWQRVVKDKIEHQAQVLEARACESEAVRLRALVPEVRSGDTTNREASAAHLYFRALFGDGFCRDDDTPVNAGLNYGYSILLSAVNREIAARGCLTQVGICHRNEYNQFNLGCDFMEPFRPVVDRLVFDNVEEVFDRNTKRLLVDMLNQSVPYRGGMYRVSSVIALYVQDCLNALNHKLSVTEIEPFDVI